MATVTINIENLTDLTDEQLEALGKRVENEKKQRLLASEGFPKVPTEEQYRESAKMI